MKQFKFFFYILICSTYCLSQSQLVSGEIVDEIGVPLPGVTVIESGTKNGTTSDLDGKYVLNVSSSNSEIIFSYLGFESVTKKLEGQRYLNIILKTSVEELEDVQVVAFQKQKKNSVIGSITTIKPSELKQPTTNLTTSLAGRLAGVISYQRSGEPGQDNAEFFIRGVTTFGYKNNPLILIDGLEVSTNDLARMEPDNIASFSIMKDATATSLYGSRGANGVILVTTKEGVKGKAKVSLRVENAFSMPSKTNKFLDGVSYMNLYNEALRLRDESSPLTYSRYKIDGTINQIDANLFPNVNWYNDLFKDYTSNKKINLNVNGGGEVAQYYLSVSHTNESGLLKVDPLNNFNNNIDINRSNLRANINIDLTKTTELAVKFSSLFERYNGPVSSATDIYRSVMNANPVNFPAYFSNFQGQELFNHTLFGNKGLGGFPNPYADMVKGYQDYFQSTILSQAQLRQNLDFITDGLELRAMASIKSYSRNSSSRQFTPFYYGIAEIDSDEGVNYSIYQIQEGTEYLETPSVNTESNNNTYFELVTEYNRTFNERHGLGGLFVFYRSESLNTLNNENAYSTLPRRNMGVSGRLSYNFNEKYFSEFNFGYNGSERFAKKERFGFFPSVGIGWIISNENFFENLNSVITLFKLRYSYGLVGNDGISSDQDRFFYLSDVTFNNGNTGYTFGSDFGNWYTGYNINRYANPGVTWEVSKKTNYGLELELNNNFSMQFEYFKENREKIYQPWQYIPDTMGLTTQVSSNIGEVDSYVIDVSMDYNKAFSSGLVITGRGNFTYSKNEVKVNGEPDYLYENLSRIGYPINQEWGLIAERLFIDISDINNSPEQFNGLSSSSSTYLPGDIKYKDINGDGIINENDFVPIGKPFVPEIIYGFGLSASYKSFDFSVFFQGSANSSFTIRKFGANEDIAPFVGERNSLDYIADNHWSVNNPDIYSFWPRLSTESIPNNDKKSTWWLRDGDFLRLKNIEIGYSFSPKKGVFEGINTRLYFTGVNLLYFSKFKLWDPEMGDNGLGYPNQKVLNMGLQLSL